MLYPGSVVPLAMFLKNNVALKKGFEYSFMCSVSAVRRSAFKGLSKELLWQRNDAKEFSLEAKQTEQDFALSPRVVPGINLGYMT